MKNTFSKRTCIGYSDELVYVPGGYDDPPLIHRTFQGQSGQELSGQKALAAQLMLRPVSYETPPTIHYHFPQQALSFLKPLADCPALEGVTFYQKIIWEIYHDQEKVDEGIIPSFYCPSQLDFTFQRHPARGETISCSVFSWQKQPINTPFPLGWVITPHKTLLTLSPCFLSGSFYEENLLNFHPFFLEERNRLIPLEAGLHPMCVALPYEESPQVFLEGRILNYEGNTYQLKVATNKHVSRGVTQAFDVILTPLSTTIQK